LAQMALGLLTALTYKLFWGVIDR